MTGNQLPLNTAHGDLVADTWRVPAHELEGRVERLQRRMRAAGIDVALLAQATDIFYLSGSIVNGWMLVPASGEPTLHLRRGVGRAATETTWSDIRHTFSMRDLIAAVEVAGCATGTIGLELDVLPAAEYRKLEMGLGRAQIVDVTHEVRSVRAVKSSWELAWMHEAATQVRVGMTAVQEGFSLGMTEIDVAIVAEHAMRRAGHQGLIRMRRFNSDMFYGQVAAGANAAVASSLDAPLGGVGRYPSIGKGASARVIGRGELLVVDQMGACNGYLSDCTRVFAVGGVDAVDEDLLVAQAWTVEVLEQVAAAARPGVTPGDLYELALELAHEAGFGDRFMGGAPDQARFVGHGIGLEVDEYPFLARGYDEPLLPGMVFALEPKLVFPGRGAVGIEDTFVVAAAGGAVALPAPARGVVGIG